ncbi:MAG: tRNA dihydrouridine(20/20a) synthase DusA [Legionellales bacterium]|nr:tRNA dihydrouridine(20/20a) synthase DusA [Legionellales bacterium]
MYKKELHTAPMMGYSDYTFRMLMRILSPSGLLYTPMIVDRALINNHELIRQEVSGPVILQLGGGSPETLAAATKLVPSDRYVAVNLNVGCPSHRVQQANMGACLMKDPTFVAELFDAMQSATALPVTIKCRLGIDDLCRYETFYQFIETLNAAGCQSFVVHARSAWLQGINPKKNRTIPPLQYDWVYQIKQAFPSVKIIINGGVGLENWSRNMQQTDGVMLGRLCVDNPYAIHQIAHAMDTRMPLQSRGELLERYLDVLEKEGLMISHNHLRHVVNLFNGIAYGKQWKRFLSTSKPCKEDIVDFTNDLFPTEETISVD